MEVACKMTRPACFRVVCRPVIEKPGLWVDRAFLLMRFVVARRCSSWAGRRVGCRQRTHNPPEKSRRRFEPDPAHQGFQRFSKPPIFSAKTGVFRKIALCVAAFIASARPFPLAFSARSARSSSVTCGPVAAAPGECRQTSLSCQCRPSHADRGTGNLRQGHQRARAPR